MGSSSNKPISPPSQPQPQSMINNQNSNNIISTAKTFIPNNQEMDNPAPVAQEPPHPVDEFFGDISSKPSEKVKLSNRINNNKPQISNQNQINPNLNSDISQPIISNIDPSQNPKISQQSLSNQNQSQYPSLSQINAVNKTQNSNIPQQNISNQNPPQNSNQIPPQNAGQPRVIAVPTMVPGACISPVGVPLAYSAYPSTYIPGAPMYPYPYGVRPPVSVVLPAGYNPTLSPGYSPYGNIAEDLNNLF